MQHPANPRWGLGYVPQCNNNLERGSGEEQVLRADLVCRARTALCKETQTRASQFNNLEVEGFQQVSESMQLLVKIC